MKINSLLSTMRKQAKSNCRVRVYRATKLQELANVMRLNLFIVVWTVLLCVSGIELKSIDPKRARSEGQKKE